MCFFWWRTLTKILLLRIFPSSVSKFLTNVLRYTEWSFLLWDILEGLFYIFFNKSFNTEELCRCEYFTDLVKWKIPHYFLFTTIQKLLSIKIKLLTDAFKFQKYGVICIRKKRGFILQCYSPYTWKVYVLLWNTIFFKKIAYCSSGNNALTHHLNCFAKIH